MKNVYRCFLCGLALATAWETAPGQTTTREEIDADGVRYRVTERTWQQQVPVIEYEARTQRVYQPQQTTQVQSYQQTYAVPVTEYRWVSRNRGWWNPFSRPYWTHHLEPFTRYDYRAGTVQVSVPKTQWVEATQTVQVPVTKYRTVENSSSTKVAISTPPSTTSPATLGAPSSVPMVATRSSDGRYGSERITKDPPPGPSRLAELPSTTTSR